MSHECRIALGYKWESKELPFTRAELKVGLVSAMHSAGKELGHKMQLDDYELASEGVLSLEIPEWLFRAFLCVFELSSSDAANVWYELGIARGIGKRCLLLCWDESYDKIPLWPSEG